MLKSVDLDIAAVELDVGDEFHGNVERFGLQIGVNDEAQLELLGADRAVASDPDGVAIEPRFISRERVARNASVSSSSVTSSIERLAMSGKP